MKLYPVYWIHRGPNIPVRRGRWFFADDRPCAEGLSDELEEGYLYASLHPLMIRENSIRC